MLQKILKILDFFLHKQTLAFAEGRLRGRLAASLFLTDLLIEVLLCIFEELWKSMDSPQTWVILAYALADILCLFLLKYSRSFERVLVAYVFLVLLNNTFDVLLFSRTLMAPSIFDFSSGVLLGFLFCPGLGNRIFILGSTLLSAAICFAFADRIGFKLPPGLSALEDTYFTYTIVYAFWTLASIFFYLRIRSIAQNELDQEGEWQTRSKRLGEIASLMKSMISLMKQALQTFQSSCAQLKQKKSKGSDKALSLSTVGASLDELLQITQSYAWLYRAYHNEEGFIASSDSLLKQLQLLVSLDAEKSGWTLQTKPVPPDITIHGPIPSIMLLLFTIITQIFKGSQPAGSRNLSIHLEQDSEQIHWTISWPFAIGMEGPSSEDALRARQAREELIADLSQDCHATVREHIDQKSRFIRVQGSWARPLPA